MASREVGRKSTKRKQIDDDADIAEELHHNGTLEMLSDEEEDGNISSDDGGVDTFPGIVNESDSDDSDFDEEEDEDEDSEDEEDEEEDEDEESDGDGDESDDSLHVFPKAKTIVSGITNQPKTVYPEIEADYDSDSSTEEVSAYASRFKALT